jgi:uncharacterized protein YndB with AHSA1/START domain
VETDAVFKALADPNRRRLLDMLHERSGMTLNELCDGLDMRRQSVSQHVELLEAANLVTSVRDGRRKLHYLNPVPIPDYVYTTYVHATPEQVWRALTDPELTGRYWGHAQVSDWAVGSRIDHVRVDGSGISDATGSVIEADPPHRLAFGFDDPKQAEDPTFEPSIVTFEIESYRDIVRLTVIHTRLRDADELRAIGEGWPTVLANLKTLLETGDVLPQAPWEFQAEERATRMAQNG